MTTLAALNHPANDINFVTQVIASADHKMLLQSGNNAYSLLFDRFSELQSELDAVR